MTRLRKKMLEELQRRNYSQQTIKSYLRTVRQFAEYFHRSPDQLGPEHIREYQAHLFSARKLASKSVEQQTAALRFLFVKHKAKQPTFVHRPRVRRMRQRLRSNGLIESAAPSALKHTRSRQRHFR